MSKEKALAYDDNIRALIDDMWADAKLDTAEKMCVLCQAYVFLEMEIKALREVFGSGPLDAVLESERQLVSQAMAKAKARRL